MKKLIVLSGYLLLHLVVLSQPIGMPGNSQNTLNSESKVLINLPYSSDVVVSALSDYLSKSGKKQQNAAQGYLLSANTLLVKRNKADADLHFAIDNKSANNKYASVIYLKLQSTVSEDNFRETTVNFDRNDAQDYLDNLAIAIQPYARKLQIQHQQEWLSQSITRMSDLVEKGKELELERIEIEGRLSANTTLKQKNRLQKKKLENDAAININSRDQLTQSYDITQQISSLDKLLNSVR